MPHEKKLYLGLGKTKFNSSVTLLSDENISTSQLILTERLTRKKASGSWPIEALKEILNYNQITFEDINSIGENRDVLHPRTIEDFYDSKFFFYQMLKNNSLEKFTSKHNSNLKFITHHDCHANAALAMSPFLKSVIIVLDGAGTNSDQFNPKSPHFPNDSLEECSIYLQNNSNLNCVYKRWIKFRPSQIHKGRNFSIGIGAFYEKISEFIFNNSTSSGKVMGLAPLGTPEKIFNRIEFQEELPWNKSFQGSSKKEWEDHPLSIYFKNLSATVQQSLEEEYQKLILEIKKAYPEYDNLILAGGCAMNCTNNAKILNSKIFKQIYILPFPGDESISFGIAHKLKYELDSTLWKPFPMKEQLAYFGPFSSTPTDQKVVEYLKGKNINYDYSQNVTEDAAAEIANGKIIGWFQGRSESGPRALGNRSILARVDKQGLKDYLNLHIKFRENFRPYGCSVIFEKAHEYFEIEKDFCNPYMSYALPVRTNYKELLREVSHIDGTSRMQIVREEQNVLFHQLIKLVGIKTGIYCVLNTSLNIMGEPIIETIEDAVRFFEKTPVDSIYIGNFKLSRQYETQRNLF